MFKTQADVQKLLHKALSSGSIILIGIDGELGVGKSNFAHQLGESFKFSVISLDEFCSPGTGQYVDGLNLCRLRRAVEKSTIPVIIEGVCLLKVLEKLRLNADIHFFMFSEPEIKYAAHSTVVTEVKEYISVYQPRNKADWTINMN